MEVHKPKGPIRGGREFAGEVGIIVLGVLIALGAEQAVQNLEWRHKVHIAQDAMRTELGYDDAPEMYARAASHYCALGRLSAIRAAVERGAARDEVVAAADAFRVHYVSYDSIARADATASDVAVHMSAPELNSFTNAYGMMAVMDQTALAEKEHWARLRSVSRTGGPLSEAERDRVLEAVELLRGDEAVMWSSVHWGLPAIRKLGITFDTTRMKSFMDGARHDYGDCVKELPAEFWDLSHFTRD